MIAVIAEDFSGAAELADVALNHGRSADVQLSLDLSSRADVICISSESRSLGETDAIASVRDVGTSYSRDAADDDRRPNPR